MRAKVTITFEYEIHPEYYDESLRNPEAMCKVDEEQFRDDSFLLAECMEGNVEKLNVKVEPVSE
jgi:hypothetical protein